MADTIKIGNLDISSFKVGGSDCSIYLGTTLLYSGGTTPPTPTYEWKQYNAGDTIPSKLFYGVKLGDPSMDTTSIEFGDTQSTGIAFIFDINSEYGWYAQDISGEQIDISEYYDETERCYTIYFSDLGFSGMPISYPILGDSFEFDIQLYEEHTSTLQWVTFSNGDTIPSDLDIYGISGVTTDMMGTFGSVSGVNPMSFTPSRNRIEILISCDGQRCYTDNPYNTDTISLIFSDVGCCDYVNQGATVSGTLQLYIYA